MASRETVLPACSCHFRGRPLPRKFELCHISSVRISGRTGGFSDRDSKSEDVLSILVAAAAVMLIRSPPQVEREGYEDVT